MSNNGWLSPKSCQQCDPCPGSGPGPKPKPCQKNECCCNKDIKRALELLLNPTIKDAIIYNEFAFVGEKFLIGTSLELITDWITEENDNTRPPNATLSSIDPCQSSFININAPGYYYPIPAEDPSPYFIPDTISRASLCDLNAIIFNYDPEAVEDFEASLKALLDKKYPCHNFKNNECCCGNDIFRDDECCCGDGIFRDINKPYSFNDNLVNITGGWLALHEAKALGKVGNILVLANTLDDINRIYFVCLESIGFYGIPA
ncbi:CotA family spore coat protein [Terrisporobacter vanillatitrophus]|uniref:CotA family spore coat protein n=1 Tax=Terrisporobacter vanillatitrophus TaxID=3058402 RepID=UPI003365F7ED